MIAIFYMYTGHRETEEAAIAKGDNMAYAKSVQELHNTDGDLHSVHMEAEEHVKNEPEIQVIENDGKD